MGKTCAFLGNDYGLGQPIGLMDKVVKQIRRLITDEGVDTFLVGEKGSYEIDTYHTIINLKNKEFPDIHIILVIANMQDLNNHTEYFDEFYYPPEAENAKRWCISKRNNWIADNTDFVIAYNKYQGRAYGFCKRAQNQGATVIELAEMMK
ncbi:MAG: hypothetical protein IJ660_03440 [Alphaproteobacteria bacterium]|nr:hypothetical protein [Alphaproteobacteria bacterium]